MKAKGILGISNTIVKDKPLRVEASVVDHELSCVRPTSSPILSPDEDSILKSTLFDMISSSFLLNPFVCYSEI